MQLQLRVLLHTHWGIVLSSLGKWERDWHTFCQGWRATSICITCKRLFCNVLHWDHLEIKQRARRSVWKESYWCQQSTLQQAELMAKWIKGWMERQGNRDSELQILDSKSNLDDSSDINYSIVLILSASVYSLGELITRERCGRAEVSYPPHEELRIPERSKRQVLCMDCGGGDRTEEGVKSWKADGGGT